MPNRLNTVGMINGIVLFTDTANSFNIEQSADLIIGMQQGDQAFLRALRQQALQVFHIDMPVGQHFYKTQLRQSAVMHGFHAMQGSMMLDRRSDDMPAAEVMNGCSNSGVDSFFNDQYTGYESCFNKPGEEFENGVEP